MSNSTPRKRRSKRAVKRAADNAPYSKNEYLDPSWYTHVKKDAASVGVILNRNLPKKRPKKRKRIHQSYSGYRLLRNRTFTNELIPVPPSYQRSVDVFGNELILPIFNPPIKGGSADMDDVVNGRRWASNPCFHFKEKPIPQFGKMPYTGYLFLYPSVPDLGLSIERSGFSDAFEIGEYPNGVSCRYPLCTIPRYPDGYAAWYDSMASRDDNAWEAMSPKLNKSSTDVLDFLYELPELGSLYETYVMDTHTLDDIKYLIGSLGELASWREIANHHLAAVFGLLPFIGDIGNIVEQLDNMKSALAKFTLSAGVFNTRRYRAPSVTFSSKSDDAMVLSLRNPGYPDAQLPCSIQVTHDVSVDYHASSVYKYTLPDCQSVLNTIAKYMSYMGITGDGKTVWEEIPFSFVVDWFFDVGKFLHEHKYDLFKVNVILADFNHSIKVTHKVRAFITVQGIKYPIYYNECVEYTRDRGVPEAYYHMQGGAFSYNKLAIAASLFAQRAF